MKKLQRCPVCGCKRLTLFRQSYPKCVKKYNYVCEFCGFNKDGQKLFSKHGARKKWNKLTNIIRIKDENHEFADL